MRIRACVNGHRLSDITVINLLRTNIVITLKNSYLFTLSVPNEGHFSNASCALNSKYTILLIRTVDLGVVASMLYLNVFTVNLYFKDKEVNKNVKNIFLIH